MNRFQTQDYSQDYRHVFKNIETFYNTVCIQSHCYYISPNDFDNCMKKLPAIFMKISF